jgi:hypothetical protein
MNSNNLINVAIDKSNRIITCNTSVVKVAFSSIQFFNQSTTFLINVQCKAIQNWHSEPTLYSEFMLIKMKKIEINK